jgi:hypothetical protein
VWQYTPVISAIKRLRQEDHKFKVSLGSIVKFCLKKQSEGKVKKNRITFFYKRIYYGKKDFRNCSNYPQTFIIAHRCRGSGIQELSSSDSGSQVAVRCQLG